MAVNHRIGFDGAVWGEDFVLQDVSLIKPVPCYALTYIEAGPAGALHALSHNW